MIHPADATGKTRSYSPTRVAVQTPISYTGSARRVMKALGMSVESDGKPTDEQHQNHVKKLWLIFKSFVNGRNGSQYLSQIPNGDPFHNWSHHNRYARGCHFQRADVEPHRKAACTVYYMVQRAEQDGYFVSFDAMQQRGDRYAQKRGNSRRDYFHLLGARFVRKGCVYWCRTQFKRIVRCNASPLAYTKRSANMATLPKRPFCSWMTPC